MSEYDKLYQEAQKLRKQYPAGTRIELISMGADPQPIEIGTRGTVTGVDDMASLMVRWDNGRGLNLAYGDDKYRVLTIEELEAEKKSERWHSSKLGRPMLAVRATDRQGLIDVKIHCAEGIT